MKNLIVRALTGAVYVLLLVGCTIYSPITAFFFFAFAAAGTLFEFGTLMNKHVEAQMPRPINAMAGVVLAAAVWLSAIASEQTAQMFALYGLLLLYILISALYRRSKEPLKDWALCFASQIYIALPFALLPLLNPGDEVLIPTPNYSLWSNTILLAGAKPVYYRCDEASDWNPDIADLRSKVTSKTRAIVIINPNNPTGALYSTDILNAMLQVAREHNLIVFSDEIYDRLVMDGLQHVSTASLAPDLTVVTMNGLSKSHSLCGYRCGWMAISGPRKSTDIYRAGIVHLTSMRLCANALAQLVIPAALDDMETPASMVRPGGRYFEQRKATLEVLDTIDGISYVKNRAAFYLFPKLDAKKFGITNDKKFAGDLLRATNILIVPGSGFDWAEPDHFRIVMLPEADQLRQAMTRLGNFLDGYHQK